jgi:hypothetical protein
MEASLRDARLVAAAFIMIFLAPRRGARFQNRKKGTAVKGMPHIPFFSSISPGGKASTPPGCKDQLPLPLATKRACLRHAGSSICPMPLQCIEIIMTHHLSAPFLSNDSEFPGISYNRGTPCSQGFDRPGEKDHSPGNHAPSPRRGEMLVAPGHRPGERRDWMEPRAPEGRHVGYRRQSLRRSSP